MITDPDFWNWYLALPRHTEGMKVRCPVNDCHGEPIPEDDEVGPGCGSVNVRWDGEVYDCFNCGIFFEDFAADPPHRRERGG